MKFDVAKFFTKKKKKDFFRQLNYLDAVHGDSGTLYIDVSKPKI